MPDNPHAEQKYPFRNTLLRYKIPARRFPKQDQCRDLALEGFGFEEVLHVLQLIYVNCYSIHCGLNDFDYFSIQKLTDALLQRHPYVLYLDLWGNASLQDHGVYELLLKRSSRTSPIFRNLRVLNLNRCGLSNIGMSHVFRFMQVNAGSKLNNIRCVSFANNKMGGWLSSLGGGTAGTTGQNVGNTAPSGPQPQQSQSLYLNNLSLLALDLSDCELGARGSAILATYLKQNFALKFLGASFNRLSGNGVGRVLEAVLGQMEFLKANRRDGMLVPETRKGLQRLCMRGNGALDRRCIAQLFQILEQAPFHGDHRLEYLDLRLCIVDQLIWSKFQSMMRDSYCDYQELRAILWDVSENAGIDNGVEHDVITSETHGYDLRNFVLRPPTEYFYDQISLNTLRQKDIDGALEVTKLFPPHGKTRRNLAEEEHLHHQDLAVLEMYGNYGQQGGVNSSVSTPTRGHFSSNSQIHGRSRSAHHQQRPYSSGDQPRPYPVYVNPNANLGGSEIHQFQNAPTVTIGNVTRPMSSSSSRASSSTTNANRSQHQPNLSATLQGQAQIVEEVDEGQFVMEESGEKVSRVLKPLQEEISEGLQKGIENSSRLSKQVEERDRWMVTTYFGDQRPMSPGGVVLRPPIIPPSKIDPTSLIPPEQIDKKEVRPRLSAKGPEDYRGQHHLFPRPGSSGGNFDPHLASPQHSQSGSQILSSPGSDNGRELLQQDNSRSESQQYSRSQNHPLQAIGITANNHAGSNNATSPMQSSSAKKSVIHRRQRLKKEFGDFQDGALVGARSMSQPPIQRSAGQYGTKVKIYHRGEERYRLKRNLKNEVEEFERVAAILEKEKTWLQ
ncbi:unnamed protein product [Amoebophrya sp. A120]|nr:unnamed protein product [Amoebophrya sp. A120]|eukprot:GSA120T00008808001.1